MHIASGRNIACYFLIKNKQLVNLNKTDLNNRKCFFLFLLVPTCKNIIICIIFKLNLRNLKFKLSF